MLPLPQSKSRYCLDQAANEKKELITSDGQKLLNMVKLYLKFLGSKKATNTRGEATEEFFQRKIKKGCSKLAETLTAPNGG